MQNLLETIAGLSDHITLRTDGQDARRPSFSLQRLGLVGAAFLGADVAIMAGAMSWVSERNLVSAMSNARIVRGSSMLLMSSTTKS